MLIYYWPCAHIPDVALYKKLAKNNLRLLYQYLLAPEFRIVIWNSTF